MTVIHSTRGRRTARATVVLGAVIALSALSISNGAVAGATEPVAPANAATDSGVAMPRQGGTSAADTGLAGEVVALEAPAVDAASETAAPTNAAPTDPDAFEAAATVRAAAVTGPPSVTVTPATGLNPGGGSTITVTGTGFDPDANNKVGVYAVFGPVDPATYFSDANRYLAAMWLHPGGAASGSPGQGELNAHGTFSTKLPPTGGVPLTAAYTDGNGTPVNCMTTQCYVITIAAHGVADRSKDTCTPVAFSGGTATPTVDRSCQPVTTPAGQPTGPNGSGNPTANGNSNGTGANGNGNGNGASNSSTLPKTGTGATALGGLGLAILAGGLLLVREGRRMPRKLRLAARSGGLDSGR